MSKDLQILSYVLRNNAGVTAICNNINPLRRIQEIETPSIMYQLISKTSTQAKSNNSTTEKSRIQVNIYHSDYNTLRQLADAVRSALEIENQTIDGNYCYLIHFSNETETYDDEAQLEGLYQTIQDYIVTFRK